MTGLRMGSLFAGYEGLGLGVTQVLDVELAWVSEIDPAPSRILAHHYPDVPNHGDITAIDWSAVEPVDVLTGGFPCQDVSAAGKRRGLGPDTRTGLWSHMAYAIDQLRPRLVVAENVRGLLSAEAHRDVEPCPWCLGDGPASGLRALGAVLGDLAELGYDTRVCGLRAADVGAPHGRFRVFVVAWPTSDTDDLGQQRSWRARDGWPGPADRSVIAADPECGRRDGRSHEPVREPIGRAAVAGRREDATADAHDGTDDRERPRSESGDRGATDPDSAFERRRSARGYDGVRVEGLVPSDIAWGAYEPAIRRWERTLGRVAPPPTEPGRTGTARLSPRFVEWMQGLDDGWVTDVPGISRNDQLKALGNGCVPQQVAAALRRLLAVDEGRWAA